jgi:phosphatidylethanolamine/phosphatidyl-N-methylethanolamine N-methyltransferase
MNVNRLRDDAGRQVRRIGGRVADEVRFFRTWASRPLRTGAVAPSGRYLARAMAGAVDPDWDGVVVELGPGTGAVTGAILRRGVSPERLVAIEYDRDFAAHLRRRFPGVQVVQGDAFALSATLEAHGVGSVAAIVSSLPLFNRPRAERRALIEQALRVLPPGQPLVQFSYGVVPPVPAVPGRWSLSASDWILRNLPPARVWTYRAVPAA